MDKLKTWRDLLKNTPKDKIQILNPMSQNWATCAVGEKLGFPCSTRHEIYELLREHDTELNRLGGEFCYAIHAGNHDKALRVLRKIEKHETPKVILESIGDPLPPF